MLFGLIACKQDTSKTENDQKQTERTADVPLKYKLTPFSTSPAYPDAELTNLTYNKGEFMFDVKSETYTLGQQTSDAPTKMCANSGKGQHIHLIIDNKPYAAKYTSTFDYDLEDGTHTLLAFLSRSYHESIKTDDAHILRNITVKDKSITDSQKITDPMVTYSRPKGTYIGKDTDKVMLDFYLSNVSLTNGYSVEANINGEKHNLTKWQPYYIEGLPKGENKISLTLMQNGKKVETPLNPVTRIFTLKEDPEPKK